MRRSDLERLFDFTYWVRDQILAQASKLSAADFLVPSGITIRDLRGTLVHTLDVEWSWRARLQGQPEEVWQKELAVADYPTAAVLAEHWRRDEQEMRSWLASLDNEKLASVFHLEPSTVMATPAERYPLWYYVMHVHTHTYQQLSDAAVILTRMRHSPGNIEFLEYADHLHRRSATPPD